MGADLSWRADPWVRAFTFRRVADVRPEVKHHPALFSAAMVLAIRENRKGQTRRTVEPQPEQRGSPWAFYWRGGPGLLRAGYGADYVHTDAEALRRAMVLASRWKVGDRLRVLESYEFLPLKVGERMLHDLSRLRIRYAADGAERVVTLTDEEVAKLKARKSPYTKPQPGRFMFLSCSRETLEITDLRAERLQEISEEDARAEGVEPAGVFWLGAPTLEGGRVLCETARGAFASLWDSINGSRRAAQGRAA